MVRVFSAASSPSRAPAPPPSSHHHHHHSHHRTLPLDLKARCDDITATFNTSVLTDAILAPIQALRRDCEAQRLWHAALDALPFPVSRVVRALADIQPIPDKFAPRIDKICNRFGITRSEFDQFFFGANSFGFFEGLSKVAADNAVAWPLFRSAISAERDRRLKGKVENSAHHILWQPSDIKRALQFLDLNIDIGRASRPKNKKRPLQPKTPSQRDGSCAPTSPERGRRAPSASVYNDGDNDDGAGAPPLDSRPQSPQSPASPASPHPKRSRADSGSGSGNNSPAYHMDWDDNDDGGYVSPFALPVPELPRPVSSPPPGTGFRPTGRIKGIWGIGTEPTDMQSLRDNEGWLTGTVLDMALEACCTMAPSFVSVPCLLFATSSQPQHHGRYAERLRGLVASDENTTFLLPLHIQGGHWALARLAWRQKTAAIFDSMRSEAHDKAARVSVRTFIEKFLNQDIIDWQVTSSPCPQQPDGSSCGIFAIANGMHLAFGWSLPESGYHVGLWRSVLGCLVSKEADMEGDVRVFWPYTASMDDRVAAVNPSADEIAQAEAAARDWQRAFTSGSISDTMALVAQLQTLSVAPASRSLALREGALRDRHRVLGELRVLGAFVTSARQVLALDVCGPEGDHDTTTNTERASTLDDELAKYRKVQATLSECPEAAVPGQLGGLAAKIADLEKAKVEAEKEDTRAASAKKKDEHRARLAAVVVERLGGGIDTAMSDALASIKRLQREHNVIEGGVEGRGIVM